MHGNFTNFTANTIPKKIGINFLTHFIMRLEHPFDGDDMKNSCIVLEGGGLRGAFTSGVLEYLLEKDVNFDRVIGVSAGACTGASFLSKQKGRNWTVNVEYPSDKRYMGIRHLIATGSYFNIQFVFEEIPNKLVPYNEEAVFKNPAEFDIVTTSFTTGKSVVITKKDMKQIGICKALIASSSIPLLARPADISGQLFFDGGVSDSIPAEYALSKHKKAVAVLTRPRGYRKDKMSFVPLLKFAFRKHPAFLKTMLNRNIEYNKTLDFCEQMEKEGKLFIIAPNDKYSIGRTEQNFDKRAAFYHHGYDLIRSEYKNLQKFLK
jgi:predicted patatin/cPLA2 family phospholipase